MGISKRAKAEILAVAEEKCFYCGSLATTIDHVHPKSKGGSNNPENLVAACTSCNQRAGSKVFLSKEHKRWYLSVRYRG